MKIVNSSGELIEDLKTNKIVFGKKEVIKLLTSTEALLRIDKNLYKLNKDYYAYALRMYKKRRGRIFSYAMENYKKFSNLSDNLECEELNKILVIEQIDQALRELEQIGIIYWDIHSQNVMVDKSNNIKIVDLDSSYLIEKEKSIANQRHNLLDLIFEMYFFYDSLKIDDYIRNIIDHINLNHYFSSSFVDYVYSIANQYEGKLHDDIMPIVYELEDKEKVEDIRKKILTSI